jgi:WD40 repeat protein
VLPDGRLASASDDNTIRVWDVGAGVESESERIKGRSPFYGLCMLPDGRLASASQNFIRINTGSTIQLWDLTTRTETACLEEPSFVRALCVLSDGRLAAANYNGTIGVWDVRAGVETVRLRGHLGDVRALCVPSNGRLASGSADRVIQLWDTDNEHSMTRLEFDAPINSVAALASNRLVAGDNLGRLHWLEIVE